MKDKIRKWFNDSLNVTRLSEEHLTSRIAAAAEIIIAAYRAGGGMFLFGNGGSAADAQHVAGEMVGRFLTERRALKAQALTTDSSVLTCLGNDYSFETIFSRQLEAGARPGDVAVALSTSGNSANVVAALKRAREMGLKTIALTGCGGGLCAEYADVLLDVPSSQAPHVQEAHAVIYHCLCGLIEAAFADE